VVADEVVEDRQQEDREDRNQDAGSKFRGHESPVLVRRLKVSGYVPAGLRPPSSPFFLLARRLRVEDLPLFARPAAAARHEGQTSFLLWMGQVSDMTLLSQTCLGLSRGNLWGS
jgi:hypothetical protein